ncbi:MAG: BON domain-containing protein [bacterium]|nr:BON domain-containing protein [bacterium]MCP5066057.1 BON domain-containing protein [bacterium]
MNAIHSNPSTRLLALACALLLVLTGMGCGDPTPEERLADATEELASATLAKEAAQTALDQLEQRLEAAQAARDKAAEAFEEVEQRWVSAKNAVGEFATDEVLHRQVNRALLEEPDLQGATITAGVEARVVTLVGGAPDAEAIAIAAELATAVPGVAEVVSQVLVESGEGEEAAPMATQESDAPETPGNVIPELPGLEAQKEPDTDEEPTPETHL